MLKPSDFIKFEEDGVIGPFSAFPKDKTSFYLSEVESVISQKPNFSKDHGESRHQDSEVVKELCLRKEIIEKVACLLGPNLVLWNSVFFVKDIGGKEIPWHQDLDFLLLDPPVSVTVWLAIDEATKENGCLEVIPGSHTNRIPHIPTSRRDEFQARADLNFVNKSKAVFMSLNPGEFIIFHKNILHRSAPNLSLTRRIGLAIRYTVPGVKVKHELINNDHKIYEIPTLQLNVKPL